MEGSVIGHYPVVIGGPKGSLHLHTKLDRSLGSNHVLAELSNLVAASERPLHSSGVWNRDKGPLRNMSPSSPETEWLCYTVIQNKKRMYLLFVPISGTALLKAFKLTKC